MCHTAIIECKLVFLSALESWTPHLRRKSPSLLSAMRHVRGFSNKVERVFVFQRIGYGCCSNQEEGQHECRPQLRSSSKREINRSSFYRFGMVQMYTK